MDLDWCLLLSGCLAPWADLEPGVPPAGQAPAGRTEGLGCPQGRQVAGSRVWSRDSPGPATHTPRDAEGWWLGRTLQGQGPSSRVGSKAVPQRFGGTGDSWAEWCRQLRG